MNMANFISHELRNRKDELGRLRSILQKMSIQNEFIFNTSSAYVTVQELIKQLEELENELYSQIAEKIKEN